MDLSPNPVEWIRSERKLWMTLNKVVGGWTSQTREEPNEIRAYWVFIDEISYLMECFSNLIKS